MFVDKGATEHFGWVSGKYQINIQFCYGFLYL